MITTKDRKYSRREALAAIGLATASCSGAFAVTATKTKPRIALQLYTVREQAKNDLPGTLKKVREMGWEYVQWSGMPDLSAEKTREALDKAGLKATTAHTNLEDFEKDFAASVRFWKTVGVKDLGPGGMMNDCKDSKEAWLKGAARFDAVGAKLRKEGIRLLYHNHSFEFEKFPGDDRYKLDILMEATRPENLTVELDTAWVFNAGVDPAAYIRKYKGRCPLIHVKDIIPAKNGAKLQFKPLGQGALDWPEIFRAAKEVNVEWYIYEQDGGEGSPFDYAKASYDFLKKNV